MMMLNKLLFIASSFSIFLLSNRSSALSIVVINQGGPESLALCTAKRCARPTDDPTAETFNNVALLSASDKGTQKRQSRLMYGFESDPQEKTRPPQDQRVKLVFTGDAIADALEPADALVIIAHDKAIDTDKIKPVFSYVSSKLKRVVLISKQTASSSSSPFGFSFGGGGGGGNYQSAEEQFRSMIKSKVEKCSLSILRCGTLKGGGAGYSQLGGRIEGFEEKQDMGLSPHFYGTNYDLSNAMTTVSHDRFALAPDIVKGDPNTMPNSFMISAKKDSTEPSPTETNICTAAVVATALVDMCNDDGLDLNDLEISLGCSKGNELPTVEQITQQVRQLYT